jgi:3-deoxy-D-manno-octulosonic-acid transferase
MDIKQKFKIKLQILKYKTNIYRNIPIFFWRKAKLARHFPHHWEYKRHLFGFVPPQTNDQFVIWMHGSGNAELSSLYTLAQQLISANVKLRTVFTTDRTEGIERIRRNSNGEADCYYRPFDIPGPVGRFLSRVKPRLLICAWPISMPVTLQACANLRIPIIIISVRGHIWHVQNHLPALRKATLFSCIKNEDRDYLIEHGIPANKCQVNGDIKYSMNISEAHRYKAESLRRTLSPHHEPILVAGSIHYPEIDAILDAFTEVRESYPDTRLILVMRFPEESIHFLAKCKERFTVALRTGDSEHFSTTDILLVNTIGELFWMYGAADLVILGGSYVTGGGHNAKEAANWGAPMLSGPSTFNIGFVGEQLIREGALRIVNEPNQLGAEAIRILSDITLKQRMRDTAKLIASNYEDPLDNLVSQINDILEESLR